MYNWNSGGAGSGDNTHLGRGYGFGRGGGMGLGMGLGMGAMRDPAKLENRLGQRFGSPLPQPVADWRTSMGTWMGSRPQRPDGGLGDPAARSTFRTGMQDWQQARPQFPTSQQGGWPRPQPPAPPGNALSQMYQWMKTNQGQMPQSFQPNWLALLGRRFG